MKEFLIWVLSLFTKKQKPSEDQPEDGGEQILSDESSTDDFFDYITNEEQEESIPQTETKPTHEMNIDYTQFGDFSDVELHLDGGHASTTPGKRTPYLCSGVQPALPLYEWKFNREIVDMIKERLEKTGMKIHIVTPENNADIPLKVRYQRANNEKSKHPELIHLFISVHANAHGDGSSWTSAKGWSAYTTKGQNNSDKFADCLYDYADQMLPEYGMTVRYDLSDGDRDWESNFTVIYGANMPAILTENMFYTNIEDTKFLLSEEGKNVIADIHALGVIKYVNKFLR